MASHQTVYTCTEENPEHLEQSLLSQIRVCSRVELPEYFEIAIDDAVEIVKLLKDDPEGGAMLKALVQQYLDGELEYSIQPEELEPSDPAERIPITAGSYAPSVAAMRIRRLVNAAVGFYTKVFQDNCYVLTDTVRLVLELYQREIERICFPHSVHTDVAAIQVWYRHSGEEKIERIPMALTYSTFKDEMEIVADIGNNHITHMAIGNGEIPHLDVIAPNLTHLKIEGFNSKFSDLQCLSKLRQLRELDLSTNNFSAGIPDVIGEISSLNKLDLSNCQLKYLQDGLQSLRLLEVLQLQNNLLERFPSVIFKLTELQALDLDNNRKLTKIDDDFLQLTKLTDLRCTQCHSLVYPPYSVCEQGLLAMRKFFNDNRLTKGIEMTVTPVIIIGQRMSGKSSLVQSLKTGHRHLTYRDSSSPLDETTKVFHVEELPLPGSQLNLIDLGDDEVHHAASRMMMGKQCLPLVVVNLEEYSTLSSYIGSKEATRKVCLDLLVNTYLSCPRLGRPILVITHVDKLSSGNVKACIKELLEQAEVIRQGVLNVEGVHQSSFQEAGHLSNMQIPLFTPEDIFEFSNDTETTSNIQSLKDNLEERSREFKAVIPRLWEEVKSFIHDSSDTPYISISGMTSKFPGEDCHAILRYMHNICDILWFERIDGLSAYLFHQLPAITEIITVLFHHCSKEQWNTCVAKFTPLINKEKYLKLIEEFISSGVIDKVLLFHLLETESKFPPELALELLKCFCIVHGPIKTKNGDGYIIPSFAPVLKDDAWRADGLLQLRLDIILRGLTLPKYVHQLITAAVLNQALSTTTSCEVAKNGATIYHGRSTTHLAHSFAGRVVTLRISAPVEQLGDSWKHLIHTTEPVFSLLSKEWKACHASFKFYCSHCLFLKDPNPDFDVDPIWFHRIFDSDQSLSTKVFQGIQPVMCRRDADRNKSSKPTVPLPLQLPCFQLTEEETQQVKSYLLKESIRYHSASAANGADGETELTLERKMEQNRDDESSGEGKKRYDSVGICKSATEQSRLEEMTTTEFQGSLKDDQTGEYLVPTFTSADADSHSEVRELTEELRITKLQHEKVFNLLSLKFEEKNVETRHMKAQLEQKDDEIAAVRTELADLQKKYEQLTEQPMHGEGKAELMNDQQKYEDEIDLRADEQATNTSSATARGNEVTESSLPVAQHNLQHMDSERDFSDESKSPAESEIYVVFPEELEQKIELLCRDLNIDDFQILQDPYKWQKVVVLALDATSKLTKPLQDLFGDSNFKVEPFDDDGDSDTEQLHWQRTLHFDRMTTTTGFATCELIVEAGTDPPRVFVVGPAHMMFDKEANTKFQTDQCDIKQIRKEIQEALPLRTIDIQSDVSTKVKIEPHPMIAYRYRYKRQPLPPNHHKLYTNDCVLFEFDAAKAQDVQKDLKTANTFRHEELREVRTSDQLQEEHMRRLQIAVKGYEGRLYHKVSIDKDIAKCKGVHLTFVLTSKDQDKNYHTLSKGDSGSIVYFIGEKIDGQERHHPWGMLVESATLKGIGIRVYRAVVLNQAFRDFEEDYQLLPEKLHLYQLPNEDAATSAPNVMPRGGKKTGGAMPLNLPHCSATRTHDASSMPSNQCTLATAQACLVRDAPSNASTTPCSSTQQASGTWSLPSGEDYSVPEQATCYSSSNNSDSDCIN